MWNRDQRLWLLLQPAIVVTTDGRTPYLEPDRSEVGREDLARRYNREASQLLEFWIGFLARRCGNPIKLAFPSQTPEACFEISTVTAFARPKT